MATLFYNVLKCKPWLRFFEKHFQKFSDYFCYLNLRGKNHMVFKLLKFYTNFNILIFLIDGNSIQELI